MPTYRHARDARLGSVSHPQTARTFDRISGGPSALSHSLALVGGQHRHGNEQHEANVVRNMSIKAASHRRSDGKDACQAECTAIRKAGLDLGAAARHASRYTQARNNRYMRGCADYILYMQGSDDDRISHKVERSQSVKASSQRLTYGPLTIVPDSSHSFASSSTPCRIPDVGWNTLYSPLLSILSSLPSMPIQDV